jgi:glycosyltransferase involved in cell wall biosynthesis
MLSVVIPCHNDAASLPGLLCALCAEPRVQRIIVVDDGSAEPVSLDLLSTAHPLAEEKILLMRNDVPAGAGVARNTGFAAVETDHVLFLDADDTVTTELDPLLSDLGRAGDFDFCLFQHHDSRMDKELFWGQPWYDQAHWTAAQCLVGALRTVSLSAAADLAKTANYPWNKIYRSRFLRDNDIRCSPIPVHNDVELHWRSFLKARRILCSDRIVVRHFVSERGSRLTNLQGAARLLVFDILTRLADEIASNRDDPRHATLTLPFFEFSIGLIRWIRSNIGDGHVEALAHKAYSFWHDTVPPAIRDTLVARGVALPAMRPPSGAGTPAGD